MLNAHFRADSQVIHLVTSHAFWFRLILFDMTVNALFKL